MTTKTRTAPTAHGDIEYKTVECDSCGNEVRKDDSYRFIIGELDEYHYWSHKNVKQYELHSSTVVEGRICEFCREQEPVGYPQESAMTTDNLDKIVAAVGVVIVVFAIGVLAGVFVL